jgi:hypothetical protein
MKRLKNLFVVLLTLLTFVSCNVDAYAATAIWSHTATSDFTAHEGWSFRHSLTPTGASQGQVRVTFKAGSTGMQIDHASIVVVGAATFPNVATTPVQLKFGGANGFTITATATITSDWVTFASLSTDTLAVIVDFTAGGTKGSVSYDIATGAGDWQAKAATASYNLATVTGFSSIVTGYTFIPLIETQSATGNSFIFKAFP